MSLNRDLHEISKEGYNYERSELAKLSDTSHAKTKGQQIALDLRRTIDHFFPDLYARMEVIYDPRKRHDYSMTELLLAAIFLFICKEGSRNAFNNDRAKEPFLANYEALFGKRLPHMDTVDDVLRELDNKELERLKASLVSTLIEKKVFGKLRLLDTYYRVAVDATGVMSVPKGHCDHCLHKTSKNGVVTYFHNILEAKLITPNGFAISLCSEWIENPEDYEKQDSEQKAFKRLAAKLKSLYPRLPICILADGLYPNAPFFETCKTNDWRYIVTLKDKSLKSLWEEIDLELLTQMKNTRSWSHPQQNKRRTFRWLLGLNYRGHQLSWLECVEVSGEKTARFVFLTDIEADFDNAIELVAAGRMRFKIENEGFNTLKNGGYGLSHKYSRVSGQAMKNYISLMHIAHLINQLYELSSLVRPLLGAKETLKNLWKDFLGSLTHLRMSREQVLLSLGVRVQFRYGCVVSASSLTRRH